ncbi:MAG TPA: VOC family protein [Burkholderiales bacterium]|nr:VOC family protein [Burkholderiales bacterium]
MPQTAAPGSLVLDHVAHFVPDLEAAARALEALGFAVTPYSAQSTQDGPAGTANRCVMLAEGYLEFLSPIADTPHARRTREAMARYAGVHILALGTPAASEEHARLERHGFAPLPQVDLERDVELEGQTRRARFGVVRVPPETMPEGRVQFVEHRTPECVWQPRWLEHTNGVTALAAAFVVADDPAEAAARYARFAGLLPSREGKFIRLSTARGDIVIGRQRDLADLLGVAPPAPALAGYALACEDPKALAARCRAAGADVRRAGEIYTAVLPLALGGTWLFGAADRLKSGHPVELPSRH